MKLASWNVNGLRSVSGKGFLNWFENSALDFVCLQEIKVKPEQLDESVRAPKGYHGYFSPAVKPGYSGIAIYAKKEPREVRPGIGIPEFDDEGRVLELSYRDFDLLSTYWPNSQRDHARLPYKLRFCESMFKYLEAKRKMGRNVLVCGDFNIAHKEIDLKNPKSNMKNAGFLPEERAWMDTFTCAGWIDTFREFEKGPGHYTWWSYRPGVREKNVGWRLDYFFTNKEHRDRLKSASHSCHVMGSDHCPVLLTLKN